MACPCCAGCTCDTSWLPREGNLTSMTCEVKRTNCAGYTLSQTLSIPQASPNAQPRLSARKVQQTSNECVFGVNGVTGRGAATLSIFFSRCPLSVLITFRDYYQMNVRLRPGFVTPWAPCEPTFFEGEDVDNSKAYALFAGFNIGTGARVPQNNFFKTESGVLWQNITGPWCSSLKTAEDTLELQSVSVIPVRSQDECIVTLNSGVPISITYELKLTLRFNMLP
jgi:hypothetical protein